MWWNKFVADVRVTSNYPSIYKSFKENDTMPYGEVTDTGLDFGPIW